MRTVSTPALFRWIVLGLLASLLSACGYNDFQKKDEAVKAAWGEVVNQYQRRADLIPNLVNTVKGYASHEKELRAMQEMGGSAPIKHLHRTQGPRDQDQGPRDQGPRDQGPGTRDQGPETQGPGTRDQNSGTRD